MKEVTLFINSLTSGGAERVLSIIATELVAQKIKVHLLCIEKENAYSLPDTLKISYLSNLNKDDSSLKKLLYLPYLAYRLKKYSQKNGTTLIQSHIYRANFTNILAKLFGAKHQVQVVEVTSINNLKEGSFSKKINYLLIKLLYPYANMVIFKAQRMQEEFLKSLPNIKKYQVINNPYDIEKIASLANESVEEFIFYEHKTYLISVGRLSAEKRFGTLIDALTKLDEEVELILIGEGVQEKQLQNHAKEQGVERRVHLLGRKTNPFKYLKSSSLFILPSEGEGFPNVIIEAMICALPVISTDCISGPREILAPHSDINFQLSSGIELAQNGILYPVDDQEALLLAIKTLLNDAAKREHYKKQGVKAAQKYALKKIIEQYKEVLCVA